MPRHFDFPASIQIVSSALIAASWRASGRDAPHPFEHPSVRDAYPDGKMRAVVRAGPARLLVGGKALSPFLAPFLEKPDIIFFRIIVRNVL